MTNDLPTKSNKKGMKRLFDRMSGPEQPDEYNEGYENLFRTNFYRYEQEKKNKQIVRLTLTVMILTIACIVFLALYLVRLNDSSIFIDKLLDSSIDYIYENVMYTDNSIKYTEVVSELNVARTLMNYKNESSNRQYVISELYYIAVQLPDSFVNRRSDIYDAFNNITKGNLDIGYIQLEELLHQMVEERK